MVLEATMICIDNSEWMRNGDYPPTRFQAQADAVNLICGAKTQSNPENTVGVLTMAGKGVRVLVTPTSDLGKILACMHGLEIGGEMNLAAGIQVAQLALKHRQNKKQQQRIIVFTGGPVNYDKKVLEMIGRKLKKNSVALDVVNFGEEDAEKAEKLDALVAAVNNNDSSHIVHVPAGPNALSDVLLSTPIFTGDGEGGSGFAAAAAAAAAGGVSGFDFGVDPNLDPELALALRVSMEEERARQEAAAKKAADDSSKQEKEGESSSKEATMTENVSASSFDAENKKDDLMMSMMNKGKEDVAKSSKTKDTEIPKYSDLTPNVEDVNYRSELRIPKVYEMSPPKASIIAQCIKDELEIPLYPIDDEDEHPKQDPMTIPVRNAENIDIQEHKQVALNANPVDMINHEIEEIEDEDIKVEQVQQGNHAEVQELFNQREQEEDIEEENDSHVSFDNHMHEIEDNRKAKRKAEQRIEELERELRQIKKPMKLKVSESISLARGRFLKMATQARDYVHNFLDRIRRYFLL